jgi:LacI family transcriptional regulator
MTRLLERNPDMSAVFVSSSQMTYGAMKAIRGRGLRVPEDISLIGFDVYDSSGLIRPGITSIIQDEKRIGLLCVELLLKNRHRAGASAGHPCQRIQLDPRIVIRESCGALPNKK